MYFIWKLQDQCKYLINMILTKPRLSFLQLQIMCSMFHRILDFKRSCIGLFFVIYIRQRPILTAPAVSIHNPQAEKLFTVHQFVPSLIASERESVPTKGQKISKGNCGVLNSSKEPNESKKRAPCNTNQGLFNTKKVFYFIQPVLVTRAEIRKKTLRTQQSTIFDIF